jgi:hypothetical protein
MWWQCRHGRESRIIHAAHRRRGPIARLALNEVSVASLDGLRKIYDSSRDFSCADWFLSFRNYGGRPNLVTMFGNHEHAIRKRMFPHLYSNRLASQDF